MKKFKLTPVQQSLVNHMRLESVGRKPAVLRRISGGYWITTPTIQGYDSFWSTGTVQALAHRNVLRPITRKGGSFYEDRNFILGDEWK
jgi:hypothetical protein